MHILCGFSRNIHTQSCMTFSYKSHLVIFMCIYCFLYNCVIIPHATSCAEYNVFDPSVSQSVSPSVLFFLSAFLWNRSTKFSETCVDAYIHKKFWFSFFLGILPLFELRNLAKMKDTIETVCQRNSSKSAQQNFVKLCRYEGHNV